MSACIGLQNVTFAYRPGHPVLDRLSFTLDAGAFLGIVGPNGAGKSTLIGLLAGLLKPDSGDIAIDGRDISSYPTRELARRVAVVRQEYAPIFGFSVAETVLMARIPHYGQLGFETRLDRDLARQALELTDTSRFADRPLNQLSGGERQRVFIARALAQDAPIILLDEPTSFLDLRHQMGIYDLLRSIQQEKGRTIVAVTHEINLAAQYCTEALLLESPADRSTASPRYQIGPTHEVLTAASVARLFGVRIASVSVSGRVAFIPMSRDPLNPGNPTAL
jgi:iron complex transport system ATP-binding protein